MALSHFRYPCIAGKQENKSICTHINVYIIHIHIYIDILYTLPYTCAFVSDQKRTAQSASSNSTDLTKMYQNDGKFATEFSRKSPYSINVCALLNFRFDEFDP